MTKYKAYPEYKDSGVEWLGDVPNHWKTIAISRLFSRTKRTGYTEKELLSVYRDYGVIPKSSRGDNNNKPSEDLSPYQLVRHNDLVMNKMKAWQGSIAISECEGIVSPAYFVYQPNKILFELAHPRYVHYLLRNPIYVTQYLSRSKGIRVNQWDLDPDEFRKIELLLPTKSEQAKIYSFLDHDTAKIDNLIEKQQQLIELLKEKRQAVISHAVTKGLNPDVPMKDSGVEWLGLISGCCSLTKLKYLVFLKTVKLIDNNSQYVGMENISSGTGQFLTKDELIPEGASISFGCGDVLFGKLRPYLAKSWLATFSGVCSSEFLVLHTRVLHPKFLNYYLLTNEFIKQVDSSTYGSKMPRANWDFIGQLPVPTWSYEESEAIAAYLDSITFKLDNLLEKQYQQVRFLQERRTALISAAVTGKIDVRDWVAPDTSEVEESQEATA
ncbi:restriction endonuclease subunit S [Buttiauxella agrestis]|uniref:Type I restriction-modification system, specificity subunit S n=1 Tax=Buttiauxella agrestis ATCC 33320 TaxID=1006004 RepID=A0A085GJZ4_9ENTR|nr:restriction endonuclease subunit S [Buttiauxella agrestis]KFC84039.1 type I restriction-modification system, specificity subunit S [Buttiauxella agrestis ATCC 33320]